MSNLFRRIPCSERLPGKEGVYIVGFTENGIDISFQAVYDDYYSFHEEHTDCSGVEWWLEPIQLSTDEEIEKMASFFAKKCDPDNKTIEKQADLYFGFKDGFKSALELLTNK